MSRSMARMSSLTSADVERADGIRAGRVDHEAQRIPGRQVQQARIAERGDGPGELRPVRREGDEQLRPGIPPYAPRPRRDRWGASVPARSPGRRARALPTEVGAEKERSNRNREVTPRGRRDAEIGLDHLAVVRSDHVQVDDPESDDLLAGAFVEDLEVLRPQATNRFAVPRDDVDRHLHFEHGCAVVELPQVLGPLGDDGPTASGSTISPSITPAANLSVLRPPLR